MTRFKNKSSYSHLNRLSTQELEALLQKDIEDPDGGNTDMIVQSLNMNALQRKRFLGNLLATIETQFHCLVAGTFLKMISYAMRS